MAKSTDGLTMGAKQANAAMAGREDTVRDLENQGVGISVGIGRFHLGGNKSPTS